MSNRMVGIEILRVRVEDNMSSEPKEKMIYWHSVPADSFLREAEVEKKA